MDQTEIADLRAAVERNFPGCSPTFREAVEASDTHQGRVAWERTVAVFDLQGHSGAKTCFAWWEPAKNPERRRYFAVLQSGPVTTAVDAVKASILMNSLREEPRDT